MTILLWKFNWPHYDTRGGIKKDAVRLALTLLTNGILKLFGLIMMIMELIFSLSGGV
jgi:hypothetical protein